jgi:hypothetical protein
MMTPAIRSALAAVTDGSLAAELRAAGETSLAARCDLDRACKSSSRRLRVVARLR